MNIKESFSEKDFYLREFRQKSLLFAFIPPVGQRISELRALAKTLRELKRNQTRSIIVIAESCLPRLLKSLGNLNRDSSEPVTIKPANSLRRLSPPDSILGAIWLRLRSNFLAIVGAKTEDPKRLLVLTRNLAARLRVFKVVLLDRSGGLKENDGRRLAFLEIDKIKRSELNGPFSPQRQIIREIGRILENDVPSVNLVNPQDVYEELFSYLGKGTLFTRTPYGVARPLSLDQFEQAQALIERGQAEGVLLPRTAAQIAELLPSCIGYYLGAEGHLAGICSLLTEPYYRDKAGEITALYTVTRFQGEGIASKLVTLVLERARQLRLRYVFACTSEVRAAQLFERLEFRRVTSEDVPKAKWRNYAPQRRMRIAVFRYDF